MLGEQVGEERGQIVVRRVIETEAGPQVEVTFQAEGQLLDVGTQDMGTYTAKVQPDGTLRGQGQGIIRGTGNEMASWTAHGVGRLLDHGRVSWRGSLFYQTDAPALARLNGLCCLFEYEVDESGKTESRLFEWK